MEATPAGVITITIGFALNASRRTKTYSGEIMKSLCEIPNFVRIGAVAGFALIVDGIDAHAADVSLLCADALEPAMRELIPEFEKTTGHSVKMTVANAGTNAERVRKEELADLVIVLP